MGDNHIGMDISSLLEVQVNEDPPSDGPEEISQDDVEQDVVGRRPSEMLLPEEKHFRKLMFGQDLAKVRFRKLHCTSCDSHIGSAPAEAYNMQEHPVLKTLLCAACREFYGDGTFEKGEDATDMFCRWCANGGNLYCCSYCSNTFCQKCIRINFDVEVRKKIEKDEKWKCFVCYPAPLYSHRAVCAALQQHVRTLSRILTADRVMSPKDILSKMELDDSQCCPGRKAKRKRRVSISSSDDDSVTSSGSTKPRKRAIKRRKTARASNEQQNGRYQPVTEAKIDDDDITSLLNPVQTMVEGDNSVILPSNPRPNRLPELSIPPRMPTLHPLPGQGMRPLTRGGRVMIPIRPLRRIDSLPPGATPHMITRLPFSRPVAPMVTIPTRPIIITAPGASGTRPSAPTRVRNYSTIRIERNTGPAKAQQAPSVIELESDSDKEGNDSDRGNNSAPIEIEAKSDDEVQIRPSENSDVIYPRLTVRKFDQNINNPSKAIDDILKTLRKRVRLETKNLHAKSSNGDEINSARRKLHIINRNISKIVSELAAFNNSMVRQYQPWKESCLTGAPVDECTEKICLRKNEPSHKFTPFDMECERDSTSELSSSDTEDPNEPEHIPIDFTDKIVHFTERSTSDRSTSAKISTVEKAIQAYDDTIDYDNTIGYSLLTDFQTPKDVDPSKPSDEYSGKYEEQFIFYLQRLADRDEKKKPSREKSLNEMIEDDLSIGEKQVEIFDINDDENDKDEITEISNKVTEDEIASEIVDLDDENDETTNENCVTVQDSMDVSDGSVGVREADLDGVNDAGDDDTMEVDALSAKVDEINDKTDDTNEKIDEANEVNDNLNDVSKVSDGITDGKNKVCGEDDAENMEMGKVNQKDRNDATVIAVRALIEDDDGDDGKSFREKLDDDECSVLE